MKNLRAVLSSVLGIFFAISLVTACSDAMLTEVKPLARKNISISAEGSSFDNIELPEEGTKKVYILVTSENGEDIANDTEITVISSDEESVTASAGAPEEMPEAPAAKRNAVFYNWFKDNDLDAQAGGDSGDGGGSSTPAPKKYKIPLELTCLKKADEDVIVTVLANCPDHFSKKIDISVHTKEGVISPSSFLALELKSGEGVNIKGGVPGGGAWNTTVPTNIPYRLSTEYKTYQIPVTLNTATNNALKVPIKDKDGSQEFSRTFQFGDETYTFKLVKSVHFDKTTEQAYTDDPDITINKGSAVLNTNRTTSGWNPGFGNWVASDTQTGSGNSHVLGIKSASGQNFTITIPNSAIGEYDYVEFSLNYWDAKAPTISFTGDGGGKMVCKPYSGNNIGVGVGNWITSSQGDNLPKFMPLLGNGTISNFASTNETYVVGGAYIPPASGDKKGVLFMQNGRSATLENQAAALVQYSDSDSLQQFYSDASGNFTMKLEDVNGNVYVFDYIAFYKKQ